MDSRFCRFIKWPFLLILISLTASCAKPPAAGKVTIQILTWGGTRSTIVLAQCLRRFEQLHPNIHVNMVTASWSEYRDKLLTVVAGGKAPDVARLTDSFFGLCADAGLLEELDDRIKTDPDVNIDDFYEPVLRQDAIYKGHWYQLPAAFDLFEIFYNKNMFDKYHVPYPDNTWDWKKIVWASQKLTKDLDGDGRVDQWGFYPNVAENGWKNYIWQNGGEVYSEDGTKCLLDQPQAYNAVQWIVDLHHKYGVAPGASDAADIGSRGLFSNGKLAMFVGGAWNASSLNVEVKDFDWDVATLPRGTMHGQFVSASGFGIVRGTKYPKESWELVKFLASPENQLRWTKGLQDAPVRRSVAESDAYLHQSGRPVHRVLITDIMQGARNVPCSPAVVEVEDIVQNEIAEALLGREDSKKACIRAARRANQLLSVHNH